MEGWKGHVIRLRNAYKKTLIIRPIASFPSLALNLVYYLDLNLANRYGAVPRRIRLKTLDRYISLKL